MSLSALCWLNWSFLVTRAEEANDISVLANIFIERDYKIGGQHISVNEYSWLEPLRSLSEYIVQFSRTPTTIRETCSRIIKEKKKSFFFPLSVVWRNNRSKNVKTFTFGVCRARKRWTKEANVWRTRNGQSHNETQNQHKSGRELHSAFCLDPDDC